MGDEEKKPPRRGEPPKSSRFKKGQSGNPRGRPRKRREGLTPSQMTRDVLRVMELPVTMKMPDGDRTLTVREASIYSLAKRAIGGERVSHVKLWLQLQKEAVQANVAAHPALLNIELFDELLRDPESNISEPGLLESLIALIRKSKGH
jgi:hypothetical protein